MSEYTICAKVVEVAYKNTAAQDLLFLIADHDGFKLRVCERILEMYARIAHMEQSPVIQVWLIRLSERPFSKFTRVDNQMIKRMYGRDIDDLDDQELFIAVCATCACERKLIVREEADYGEYEEKIYEWSIEVLDINKAGKEIAKAIKGFYS